MRGTQYTKCELIEELKRCVIGAHRRGCKIVSIEENDFLEIMRRDELGGLDELEHVMNEIDVVCNCRHNTYTENHTRRFAFIEQSAAAKLVCSR